MIDEYGNTIIRKGDKEEAIIIEEQPTKEEAKKEIDLTKKTLLQALLSFISNGFVNTQKVSLNSYEKPSMANTSKDVFVFRGRGWGHAVGMSQNGAKGMANNGFSAEEIIKWYYTGVNIEG